MSGEGLEELFDAGVGAGMVEHVLVVAGELSCQGGVEEVLGIGR